MDRKTRRPLTVAEARTNLQRLMQRSAVNQGMHLVRRAPGQAMFLAFLTGIAFSLSAPLQNLVREIVVSWFTAGRVSPNRHRPAATGPVATLHASRTRRRSVV